MTCKNWFHFECSNISHKSFIKFSEKANKNKFLCKICKFKSYCVKCKCGLPASIRSIYCVGCLDKYCPDCLSLESSEAHSLLLNRDKPFFCNECSRDHFCNVCRKICIDGCIFCDACHSWIHYRCTKLKKSQIISYAKTCKKYYCNECINLNLPFSKVSAPNLCLLNSSDQLVNTAEVHVTNTTTQIDISCNLCLECNPECTTCYDGICVDARRICDTCLICSYVLDKSEFNRVYHEFSSNFKNLVSTVHFNARSLSKNLKSITELIADSKINFDLIGITVSLETSHD